MSRPDQGSPSYAAVLALPHARAPFAAALVARLCYGLQGLPLLITVRNATGSVVLAAAATSAFGLGAALGGPARARLTARRPHALVALASGYAATLTALAIASTLRLPALAVGLAVLAGLCPPPVGPLMRALWGTIAPDQARLQRALSLDTAAESTAFAVGPAAAGMLIKAIGAPVVLIACAVLVLAGCGSLARASATVRADVPGEGDNQTGAPGAFGLKSLLGLTGPAWAVAAAACAAEIAVVASWGTVTAGVLLALFPVGGVLGGLAYGCRDWRVPLAVRPRAATLAAAACYALPALAFLPVTVGGTLLLAGAGADIMLVATYQLIGATVPEGRRAEAGAWVNTAYNLGAAMGTAAGGALATGMGPRMSFVVMAAVTGACTGGAGLTASSARRSARCPATSSLSRPARGPDGEQSRGDQPGCRPHRRRAGHYAVSMSEREAQ